MYMYVAAGDTTVDKWLKHPMYEMKNTMYNIQSAIRKALNKL